MATFEMALPTAQPGDRIQGAALAEAAQRVGDMADSLQAAIAAAPSGEERAALRARQDELLHIAAQLDVEGIELLVGQARVSGEQVLAAIRAAQAAVDGVADLRSRLKQLGALVDFAGVVLTGKGDRILGAAWTLKAALNPG